MRIGSYAVLGISCGGDDFVGGMQVTSGVLVSSKPEMKARRYLVQQGKLSRGLGRYA